MAVLCKNLFELSKDKNAGFFLRYCPFNVHTRCNVEYFTHIFVKNLTFNYSITFDPHTGVQKITIIVYVCLATTTKVEIMEEGLHFCKVQICTVQ